MKRPNSSDSMAALISICPNSTGDVDEYDEENSNPVYGSTDFQAVLQGFEEEEEEECGGGRLGSEKKRRLGVDQVKALEKNFEVESKLEPERKVKLARELGLQPRQVAVWFQNRRARWKTKQLERDYGVLKASHDALKTRYDALQKENKSLLTEIKELKRKMSIEDEPITMCVKERNLVSDSDEGRIKLEEAPSIVGRDLAFGDVKDGSSDDSDSSAILNNEDSKNCNRHHQFLEVQPSYSSYMDTSCFQFVKIEEHSFIDEESCSSLFSDDQAPTLHWYSSDDWN